MVAYGRRSVSDGDGIAGTVAINARAHKLRKQKWQKSNTERTYTTVFRFQGDPFRCEVGRKEEDRWARMLDEND